MLRIKKMGGRSGRTSQLAAAVLLTVNFTAMIFSGVLFALSLWIITSPATLSSAVEKLGSPVLKTLLAPQALSVSLGVALAALALFFFFVSFMGFFGAITKSQFLLFMYAAFILLLLLLECALLYYFTSTLLEKGLQIQDGQWTHALRIAFSCCENKVNVTSAEAIKLPWSCCGRTFYPDNCTLPDMFRRDCQLAVSGWLNRYLTAIYASLAATHLVLSSCSLLRRTRSHS